MRERAAEMDYDERAELKFGAPYPDADPGLDGEDRFAVECVCSSRAGESEQRKEPVRTARRRRRLGAGSC